MTSARPASASLFLAAFLGLLVAVPACGSSTEGSGGSADSSGGGAPTTTTTTAVTTGQGSTVTCMASGTAGSMGTVCLPRDEVGGGGAGGGTGGAGGAGGAGVPPGCLSPEDAMDEILAVDGYVILASGVYVDGDQCCYSVIHSLCH